MLRTLAVLLACIILCAPLRNLPAQTAQVVSILVSRNPTIADLQRAAPEKLSSIVTRLERLTTGTRQGDLRTGVLPTEAEKAQIAANPEFALAYDRYPLATITLLRSVNEILRKARDATQ
jgi:hypothetical protein